ncbi:hypothetical protein CLAFUW4_14260 [Fulvia fulva]|uniref:Uncharacterized protein n=1 Tax=Passalora fulva TaxID=5499 RepID=A0A9Q8PMW7_PASFU|nr:uncharacterized protein CLAFUR5_14093 [Fulvia fulva]UJO25396.1 hypothetical protein CLAFUR5_14093 [Fulvia fulva]WPV22941.1 hypothetical protein CLAFUW4_14260 [Fulvia fulva]
MGHNTLPSRPEDGQTNNFPLVLVDQNASIHDRQMTQHFARAHTAKVNRRKHRDEIKHSRIERATTSRRVETFKSKTITAVEVPTKLARKPGIKRPTVSRAHSWPPNSTLIPRSLAPVFDGLAVSSFDPAVTPEAARVADFYLNVVYPGRLPQNEALVRFQAFCEHRVIFHVFHYGAAAYQNLSNNQGSVAIRNEMLQHKSKSIHELSELLTNLAPENIEIAILAVLFLGTSEVHDNIESTCLLPLFPHLPYAKWIGVWGRMKPVAAHADALDLLVNRQGSLEQLQMPGLALNIARFDLRYASLSLSSPKFLYNWPIEEDILTKCQALQHPSAEAPGNGFRAMSGKLPPDLLSTLLVLAAVDQLIRTQTEAGPTKDLQGLEGARSGVHHRILSLPSWERLPTPTNADWRTYECCRLVATLYSSAIMSGLPPDTGWSRVLVTQLRKALERHGFVSPTNTHWLIWVLVLGGIASLDSRHRN